VGPRIKVRPRYACSEAPSYPLGGIWQPAHDLRKTRQLGNRAGALFAGDTRMLASRPRNSPLERACPMRYGHHVRAKLGARGTMGLLNWFKSLFFGAPTAQPGVSPFPPDAGPVRLIVLRHAEKTGDRRDRNLSPAGHERAARLVPYILESFGRPDFLIAAKSSDRSRRPVETIEPLAAALGLEIKSKFDDDEVDALVAALGEKRAYRGKFGVISWRHSDIPRLVATLGAPADTLPGEWGQSDYTTLVEINYIPGSGVTAKRLTMPF